VLGYLISTPWLPNQPTGFEVMAMCRLAEVGSGDKGAGLVCAGIGDIEFIDSEDLVDADVIVISSFGDLLSRVTNAFEASLKKMKFIV